MPQYLKVIACFDFVNVLAFKVFIAVFSVVLSTMSSLYYFLCTCLSPFTFPPSVPPALPQSLLLSLPLLPDVTLHDQHIVGTWIKHEKISADITMYSLLSFVLMVLILLIIFTPFSPSHYPFLLPFVPLMNRWVWTPQSAQALEFTGASSASLASSPFLPLTHSLHSTAFDE